MVDTDKMPNYGTSNEWNVTSNYQEQENSVCNRQLVSQKRNVNWFGKHASGPNTVSRELINLCLRGYNTKERVKPILIYRFPQYFTEQNFNKTITDFLREEYDKSILSKIN
jgi:hypothetical protein